MKPYDPKDYGKPNIRLPGDDGPNPYDSRAKPQKADMLTIITTLIAAAIVIPIGWWVKDTGFIANWLRSIFTG